MIYLLNTDYNTSDKRIAGDTEIIAKFESIKDIQFPITQDTHPELYI